MNQVLTPLTPGKFQALRGRAIDFRVDEGTQPHPLDFVYRGCWDLRKWHNGTIGVRSVVYRGCEIPLPAMQLMIVSAEGNASVLDFMGAAEARQLAADILEAIEDTTRAYEQARAHLQGGAA